MSVPSPCHPVIDIARLISMKNLNIRRKSRRSNSISTFLDIEGLDNLDTLLIDSYVPLYVICVTV